MAASHPAAAALVKNCAEMKGQANGWVAGYQRGGGTSRGRRGKEGGGARAGGESSRHVSGRDCGGVGKTFRGR